MSLLFVKNRSEKGLQLEKLKSTINENIRKIHSVSQVPEFISHAPRTDLFTKTLGIDWRYLEMMERILNINHHHHNIIIIIIIIIIITMTMTP